MNNQPIFILPQESTRTTGRDAQRLNIAAAKLVGETVRTTLGPKGMDKMLIDGDDITVTNDGVTILEQMNISHPAAKMIVEIAKTQEAEVGDGTTTAVVLAGELLKNAEVLLDKEIHPTIIARGFRVANEKAQEILNEMAKPLKKDDREILIKLAHTAMTGKGTEDTKDHLAEVVVNAVLAITNNGNFKREDIKIEKHIGGTIQETELIQGIVLDKERVHAEMPSHIINAKILLLDSALEIKNTELDAKISINDPQKLQAFLDMEEAMLKKMTDKIIQSGANVVFCQKGIDDLAQHFLAKNNILAARRVKKSDLERLSKATGAKIVTSLDDISLGEGDVEEIFHGDEGFIYVKNCPKAKAVTIMVRGGTEHVVDEIKRALEDAVGDLTNAIKDGKVVAGAGAPEIELSKKLLEFSITLSGREQLAVKAFAEALEVIPTTLAENAGIDPIDALTLLKVAHDKGEKNTGINVFTGEAMDAWKTGVIEPLKIKTQAISSASEVAMLILRIDDVISSEPEKIPDNIPMQ